MLHTTIIWYWVSYNGSPRGKSFLKLNVSLWFEIRLTIIAASALHLQIFLTNSIISIENSDFSIFFQQ